MGLTCATMIRLKDVRKTYHRGPVAVEALRGVTLDITPGEFVAVTGKSGCGKSTLLHIIGGLEPPSSGQVLVEGRDLATLRDPQLTYFRRDRVGVVFQSFNLLPLLTLEENVALPRALQGTPFLQAREEAGHWLGEGRPDRAPPSQTPPGFRRRDAAGCHCPGPHQPAGGSLGRRAHRQPGLRHQHPHPGVICQLHQEGGHTIVLVSHAPEAARYATGWCTSRTAGFET
jgi:ABC-type lipoprotein export system ATPase subunit